MKFPTVSDYIIQHLLSLIDNNHDIGQLKELFKNYMPSD